MFPYPGIKPTTTKPLKPLPPWTLDDHGKKLEPWLVGRDEMTIVVEYLDAVSITKLGLCSKHLFQRFVHNNEVWSFIIARDLCTIKVNVAPNIPVPNPFYDPEEGLDVDANGLTRQESTSNASIAGAANVTGSWKSKRFTARGAKNPHRFIGANLFVCDHILDGDLYLPPDSATVEPVDEVLTWNLEFHAPTPAEIDDCRDQSKKELMSKNVQVLKKMHVVYGSGEPHPEQNTGYPAKSMYYLYRKVLDSLSDPYVSILKEVKIPSTFGELLMSESELAQDYFQLLSTVNITQECDVIPKNRVVGLPAPQISSFQRDMEDAVGSSSFHPESMRMKITNLGFTGNVLWAKQHTLNRLGLALSVQLVSLAAKFLLSPGWVRDAIQYPTTSALAPLVKQFLPKIGKRLWPVHYSVIAATAGYGVYRLQRKYKHGRFPDPISGVNTFSFWISGMDCLGGYLLAHPFVTMYRAFVPSQYRPFAAAVETLVTIGAISHFYAFWEYSAKHTINNTKLPLDKNLQAVFSQQRLQDYIATVASFGAGLLGELALGPLGFSTIFFGFKTALQLAEPPQRDQEDFQKMMIKKLMDDQLRRKAKKEQQTTPSE